MAGAEVQAEKGVDAGTAIDPVHRRQLSCYLTRIHPSPRA